MFLRVFFFYFCFVAIAMSEPMPTSNLISDEAWAIAYSGFRLGQHPDRGEGAKNPSESDIIEDLDILVKEDFKLIRMYDCDQNTQDTLKIIRSHQYPIKVLLGVWLDAEISNHEGCEWLEEIIPQEELEANKKSNAKEVIEAIRLCKEYSDIIAAVNVGNESLVSWNDHMNTEKGVIGYIQKIKSEVAQPVTTAEPYYWWKDFGEKIAAEVDFLGVHIYPLWEGQSIDNAMEYTINGMRDVIKRYPNKQIAILEAGWATTASEFGERAGESYQKEYYTDLKAWAIENNISVFFFEAFDEPWKGESDELDAAEKNWGIYFENRTPKLVLQ
jgi:exo-beta-1,3-glucanase (GH17 family)